LEVPGKGEEVTRSAVVFVGEDMASEVEEEVELLHLEEEVRNLAGRVSAFREKGLDYFTSRAADLNPGKRRRDSSNGHTTEEEEAGEWKNFESSLCRSSRCCCKCRQMEAPSFLSTILGLLPGV
jgi:hypothetical protein